MCGPEPAVPSEISPVSARASTAESGAHAWRVIQAQAGDLGKSRRALAGAGATIGPTLKAHA